MTTHRIWSTGLALAALLFGAAAPVAADRGFGGAVRAGEDRNRVESSARDSDKSWGERGGGYRERRGDDRHDRPKFEKSYDDHRGGFVGAVKKPPGWVRDHRHRHNHYYPKHGVIVNVLPSGYHVASHRKTSYYFHGGIWYRPSGTRYVVVNPPFGLTVGVLPPYYSTVWVGAIPYYYAAGVYYVWRPEQNAYVVSQAPPDSELNEYDLESEKLFVYPKKGQSDKQQATDRYECHRWAVEQTGFDPTLDGGNVQATEHTVKRADYRRATKACLEARDYSVK